MQDLAKGQSGIMVAAVSLMLAIPLSQIPDFALKYATASSFDDMERNSMRYQSAANSYKFTSQDENNRINYTEVNTQISTTGSIECDLKDSLYQFDEYNVSFSGVSSGATFTSENCLTTSKPVAGNPENIYPAIPFYEVKDGDVNRVISTVVP